MSQDHKQMVKRPISFIKRHDEFSLVTTLISHVGLCSAERRLSRAHPSRHSNEARQKQGGFMWLSHVMEQHVITD